MFPLWGNGSGAWLRALASELVKKGHDVAIVAPEKRRLPNVKHYVVSPPQMGVFVGNPELVDAKKVTQTMRELGAKDIQVLRGVEDGKAFAKGLNNTTTAYDLLLLFEKMAKGKIISAHASEAMINILLDQRFNEIIPAGLPPGVKIAHKTGSITGVFHDSGIIFLPSGKKYLLVLLSKNVEDEKSAIKAMAAVSAMIYNYVLKK